MLKFSQWLSKRNLNIALESAKEAEISSINLVEEVEIQSMI